MSLVGIALALLSQTGASAPAPPQSTDPAITVTGRRSSPPVGDRDVRDVVHAARGGQVARFEEPFCPGMLGAAGPNADGIVSLIRDNARAAGARLARPTCRANALVVVTSSPKDFVAALLAKQPMTTLTIDRARLRWLKESEAPIRSWQVTATEGRTGERIVAEEQGPAINRMTSMSRLVATTRETTVTSIAVLDLDSMDGRTVRPIADIATLHLLLDVAANAPDGSADTILALFDREPSPPQMTSFDRGLLAGVYRTANNGTTAADTRRRMRQSIARQRTDEAGDE